MSEDWAKSKVVDSEIFLTARDRQRNNGTLSSPRDNDIFNRHSSQGDAARKLFPTYSHAAPATVGQVTVNGKVLQLWNFSQLESLNTIALRKRALAIRDVVGEANCPSFPSGRTDDLTRWILQMQESLTNQQSEKGRSGGYGTGHHIPKTFMQETKEMEQTELLRQQNAAALEEAMSPKASPRKDNYRDLKMQKGEFKEDVQRGIQTGRIGGEGKRHIQPKQNMVDGISTAEVFRASERRRYIPTVDNLMEQKQENEARERALMEKGCDGPVPVTRPSNHVSEDHFAHFGCTNMDEPPVGGDRKKHNNIPKGHFVNLGHWESTEAVHGKKHLDNFQNKTKLENHAGRHESYEPNWRKNPQKLLGSSMLC